MSANERNGRAHLVVRTDSKTVEMEADDVVAATEFKSDLARLPFLEPGLLSRFAAFNVAPKLNRGFESSVPGLPFVGMLSAPTFGPVMRFMFGAKHAAPTIAGRLAKRAPSLAVA